ncbi:TetR/AcrR family transcriptional regulator [Saccharibacillus kuerlensis]|uniref:TetR family transcriptional regulator n=1 Tax=Saccharibacillus kuerlensis TaxID=459527 RepID=A0ABQ2L5F8_9BACL|nr:TetR/AcrR family transcriptional regulator [Saccharibacillus kuerlensis]GGO01736.1 TetR family transcriptional regulator [Saccharibacillus kuerlensis]
MAENEKKRIDPRVLRTRQMLKEALIELLEEMDVEKITVNRIAERATINRVTFYLHYKDIQDMLEKMADEMAENVNRVMMRTIEQHKSGDRETLLLGLLEHIAANAKFYKVVLGSRRIPVFHERLRSVFVDKIKLGIEEIEEHNPDIQSDVAVWFGSAALIGTISAWLRNDMPYTAPFMARQFALLFKQR